MSWQISFFIAEDEPASLAGMIKLIDDGKESSVCGSASSIGEALRAIPELQPEALLLDIKLIGGDAFSLMDRLLQQGFALPPVVIATGHLDFELAQQALNTYRDYVVYILQKPLLEDWPNKYAHICDAIRLQHRRRERKKDESSLVITTRKATYKLKLDEIEYIESSGRNSINIHTSFGDKIRKSEGIGSFLKSAPDQIVRIHRQHAVHLDKIHYIDHEDQMLFLLGHKKGLTIGDSYYREIKNRLSTDRG